MIGRGETPHYIGLGHTSSSIENGSVTMAITLLHLGLSVSHRSMQLKES